MAQQVLNNGETHGVIRGKANDNFNELYNSRDTHLADNMTNANGAHGLKIETGDFTPYLTAGGGGTFTYLVQKGKYHKIGNRVFIDIYLNLSSKGTSSGEVYINGFPFVPKAEPDLDYIYDVLTQFVANGYKIKGWHVSGVDYSFLQFNPSTNTEPSYRVGAGDLNDNSIIRISGNYLV